MKSTELRIGNLVRFVSKNEYWPIAEYHFKQLIDGDLPIEGIPLTEEWLIKFNEQQLETLQTMNVSIDEYLGDRRTITFHGQKFDVMYEYVHQLQNLYFALTNEELTIKEL